MKIINFLLSHSRARTRFALVKVLHFKQGLIDVIITDAAGGRSKIIFTYTSAPSQNSRNQVCQLV